jgi:hypothetical protein
MNGIPWPSFLLWCAIINYGILLLSFIGFAKAHEAIYGLHRRWFDLPKAQFDAIVYVLLGLYKLGIWFFLIVPCLVMYLIH